jgi:hypothetical protein
MSLQTSGATMHSVVLVVLVDVVVTEVLVVVHWLMWS